MEIAMKALLANSLMMAAMPAQAEIIQSAIVQLNGIGSADYLAENSSLDIDRVTSAMLGIPANSANPVAFVSAGIDIFGNVGMEARAGNSYTYSSQIEIEATYVNPYPTAAHAVTNFIIDGGQGYVEGLSDSEMSFELVLKGGPDSRYIFAAGFDVQTSYRGSGKTAQMVSMADHPDDIGATLVRAGEGFAVVEIPLSFQTLDLGIIQSGELFTLNYKVEFKMAARGSEMNGFAFSDPDVLRFDAVQFTPVGTDPVGTVPEPATLMLVVPLLAAVRVSQVRRAPRVSRFQS